MRRRFPFLAGRFRPAPPSSAPVAGRADLALIARADAHRDAGRLDQAAEAYAAVLAGAPYLTGIRIQLGNMLKDTGRANEAEAAYRRALLESPDDADIHVQLGHALKLMGRRPAALAAYRRAAALDPWHAGAAMELREAGEPAALSVSFDHHLRLGGIEAMQGLATELAALRAQLDAIGDRLPDWRSFGGYPVARYDRFRQLHDIPPPPDASGTVLALLAAPDRLPDLYGQLAGLRAQSMPRWRALVIGADPDQRAAVLRAALADPRIGWMERRAGEPPAAAEARAAAAGDADWLFLPAPGAVPHPHALGWILAARDIGGADALFFDEETIERTNDRAIHRDPVLRQARDRDMLRANDPCGGSIAIRRDAYPATPPPADTLDELRRALLLHAARAGHVPYPLVSFAPGRTEPEPPRVVQDELTAAEAPFERIAVIVPTRDGASDVALFADSLLRLADRPETIDIAVLDNGSAPDQQAALARLAGPRVSVSRIDEPFNWSRLNNAAARQTDAPILLFANDDMRMLTPGWDTPLRAALARREIGAVGARLLYPDDTVQHAGVLMGWRGSVIHDGLHARADDPGPNGRWHAARAVGAVTGAFLATRRATFLAQGGFDERELPVAYSDIDYALKLRAAGLLIFWTPAITLHHHESKTRGMDHADPARRARNEAERQTMARRWHRAMTTDPGVHPAWLDATLPFRLLAMPSAAHAAAHIRLTSAEQPWRIPPGV